MAKEYQVLQSVFMEQACLDFLAQKQIQNQLKILVVHNDLKILLLKLLKVLYKRFAGILKTEIASNNFCQILNA